MSQTLRQHRQVLPDSMKRVFIIYIHCSNACRKGHKNGTNLRTIEIQGTLCDMDQGTSSHHDH